MNFNFKGPLSYQEDLYDEEFYIAKNEKTLQVRYICNGMTREVEEKVQFALKRH